MKQPDHLHLQSPDLVSENIERIAALFPNCVTEGEHGKVIDFDLLRQELSRDLVDGPKERYRLEWPGKRQAIVTANLPTTKTLRPVREDSVDFDTTQNLYIEGDNLEVLKLLQESYLGKVKMIYIDPPYNTGKDFVYRDNFTQDTEQYLEESGQKDEYGQRMVVNPDSSGRYHSDWLSMIYPRLKLARNLLKDEGAVFVSLDNNEIHNLRKVCDEIFGEINFVTIIANTNNPKGRSDDKFIATAHEYIVIYARDISYFTIHGFEPDEKITKRYNKKDVDGLEYREIDLRKTGDNDLREDRPNLFYYFLFNENTGNFFPTKDELVPDGYKQIKPIRQDGREGNWRWGFDTAKGNLDKIIVKFMPNRQILGVFEKDYLGNRDLVKPTSSWAFKDVNSERGSESFVSLGFDKKIFPKPKPVGTIRRVLEVCTTPNEHDIILDFFSGSATAAQAVLELNAVSKNGNRKYILVQVPEQPEIDSEAYKAGYKNICEIGKERIRRAAKKLKEETKADIDYGFRVYRLAESNMQDVYHRPQDFKQDTLDLFADNVRPDRTADDLLAQVMLAWGLPLSLPIERATIAGKEVFRVENNSLLACFDKGVDEAFAKEAAKEKPLRILFRDNGFKDDTAKENVRQLLKQLSPETEMRVI